MAFAPEAEAEAEGDPCRCLAIKPTAPRPCSAAARVDGDDGLKRCRCVAGRVSGWGKRMGWAMREYYVKFKIMNRVKYDDRDE